jgi:hypothetical protein
MVRCQETTLRKSPVFFYPRADGADDGGFGSPYAVGSTKQVRGLVWQLLVIYELDVGSSC